MKKPAKIIAAAAGTIALAGGIGAGLAYADSPHPDYADHESHRATDR